MSEGDEGVKKTEDRKDLKEQAKREKFRRDNELADVKAALTSTPAGRRVLWRILELCNVERSTFSGEETHKSAFREGQRTVGTTILADAEEADLEGVMAMKQEAKGATK